MIIKHISFLARICILSAATVLHAFAGNALAQDADTAFNAFAAIRDGMDARAPTPADFQKLCAAGMDFLAAHPGNTQKARQVVNDMLGFGTKALKDKRQRAAWYSHVQFAIVEKQISLADDAKGAFAALGVAMIEGEVINAPSNRGINEWRVKINELASIPSAKAFVLDREKGYYNAMSRVNNDKVRRAIDTQLAMLAKSDDREIATWAKQQARAWNLRKKPLELSFMTIDGKQFSTANLKGTPLVYVYFWSMSGKNSAKNMARLMDMYHQLDRRQFEVIAVCCDPEEKRDEVRAFVKKHGIKCPVYFDGQGANGELFAMFGIDSVAGGNAGFLFDNKGMYALRINNPKDMMKKFIRGKK